jgi:hypothetical protein
MTTTTTKSDEIRRLNDKFRSSFAGGVVNITSGIHALNEDVKAEVLRRVREYDRFTWDNDPYGEHDFGSFEIGGTVFMWKLDYYDRDLQCGSEDPADPGRTTRVLTVMLASEY